MKYCHYNNEEQTASLDDIQIGDNSVLGDVTGDGMVDVEDVNAIINIILRNNPASYYPGNADVNNDNNIDVEDVNLVINIILNNH